MDDVRVSSLSHQDAEQVRRHAEEWLSTFEIALQSRDADRIGALFHADSHWRDDLAFTWHLSSEQGRDTVAGSLAAHQGRTQARDFHIAARREPAKRVTRLGRDRIGPVWGLGGDGELRNMYVRTPQPGVWFIAGGLPQCRINSKYLAIQIKAMELGILEPLRAV